MALPNESRLSCGRNARGRKETEPQITRLAGEGTPFFPRGRPTLGADLSALGKQSAAGTGVSRRWTVIQAPAVQPLVATVVNSSASLHCI
jgi:hypothetical protein